MGPFSYLAWCVLQGCAVAQLVMWVQTAARIGRRRALGLFACALIVDIVLNVALEEAPMAVVGGALLFSAIASPLLLGALGWALFSTPDLFGGSVEENDSVPVETAPFGIAAVSFALYGIAIGSIRSNGGAGSTDVSSLPYAVQATTALVAVVILLFSLCYHRFANPDAILRVFLLAVLVGSVYLVGTLGSTFANGGMLSSSVARSAVCAYAWVLACEARPHPTRAAFVFSVSWGLFTLFQTLSTKLGIAAGGTTVPYLAYTVLVIAALVALVSVNAYPRPGGERRPLGTPAPSLEGQGRSRGITAATEQTGAETTNDPYEVGCACLAERFNLTPREAEVLLPLVRGRSNSSIADSLVVGVETVRTHVRHIYQNTGIHSREELMDTVELLGRGEKKEACR